MRKYVFFAVLMFAPFVHAYEKSCGDECFEDRPTCAELGYRKSSLMTCPNGYLLCPYEEEDGLYVRCKEYECADANLVRPEDKTAKENDGYICHRTPYHGKTCYNCIKEEADLYIWNDSNKGEGDISDCSDNGLCRTCINTCKNKDIPSGDGVIPVTRPCTACGVTREIIVDYDCAGFYEKIDLGCKFLECPTPTTNVSIPYSTNVADCNSKAHPEGWTFDAKGTSGGKVCGRCLPKICSGGYQTGISCSGDTQKITNGYSGDDECVFCKDTSCTTGYSKSITSVSKCSTSDKSGWSASKAWELDTDPKNSSCKKCTAKTCGNGYSSSIQSISDCQNTSGYTFEYDQNIFSGLNYCGKCTAKTSCAQGYPSLNVSDCKKAPYNYPSTFGASVATINGVYMGDTQCKECVCISDVTCLYGDAPGKTPLGTAEGSNPCCDGSYKTCTPTCDKDFKYDGCPDGANCSVCTACGTTKSKIDSCKEDEGYILENGVCVYAPCKIHQQKDNAEDCGTGYYGVKDNNTGCYKCEPMTCAKYGDEIGKTWLQYTSEPSCSEGYEVTKHDNQSSGGTSINCYDCDNCSYYSGYLESVPEHASDYDTVKSCDKTLYCATACDDGYQRYPSPCACSPKSCSSEFKKLSELGNLPLDDLKYFNYDTCKSGDETLYYIKGCASGFLDKNTQSCSGFWGEGAAANGFNCLNCLACNSDPDKMSNASGNGCCLKSQNVCAKDTYLTGTCPDGRIEGQGGYTNSCGYACHPCAPCTETCGTGYAYDGQCPSGYTQETDSPRSACNKPCYGCTCLYQYDIAHYPNAKSGSKTCKRDGVTYYEEVCSGQQAPRSPCNGDNDKYWSHVCHSYNGMSYPYGTCKEKPTVKMSVDFAPQNYFGTNNTNFTVTLTASVDGKSASVSANGTRVAQGTANNQEVNINKVIPNNYPIYHPTVSMSFSGSTGNSAVSCSLTYAYVGEKCYSLSSMYGCSSIQDFINAPATLSITPDSSTVVLRFKVECENHYN